MDLTPLEDNVQLIKLHAAHNKISKLLDYNTNKQWSEEKPGIGSLLEYCDLSYNHIYSMLDITQHRFLNTLILNHNNIKLIKGLHELKYLTNLDLSYNVIENISGLDDLNLKTLNLSHNKISKVTNLSSLTKLISLDLSYNKFLEVSEIGV